MKIHILLFNTIRTLRRNMRRSLLTILGIVIGVASICAIISLGDAYKKKIVQEFTNDKSESIKLSVSYEPNNYYDIVDSDLYYNNFEKKLLEDIEDVDNVEYSYNSTDSNELIEVKIGQNDIQGIVSKLKKEKKYSEIIGRNINEMDIMKKNRVIVISESILKDSIKDCDKLVGSLVTINNISFEIIGIIKNGDEGVKLYSDYDEMQVPQTTYKKYFSNDKKVVGFNITLKENSDIDNNITQIENKLNSTIDTKDGQYYVNDSGGTVQLMGSVLNSITMFIALVAGISLFIAGIGVMNMSYTNVSERTFEIGIKRALGAQKNDIKREFLLEGIMISLIGGIIGYILAIIIANFISAFMGMVIVPNLFTISIAIGISTLVGLIASIFPASKAANQNTVDILK